MDMLPQFGEYAAALCASRANSRSQPGPRRGHQPATPPPAPPFMAIPIAVSGTVLAAAGASSLAQALAPVDAAASHAGGGAEPDAARLPHSPFHPASIGSVRPGPRAPGRVAASASEPAARGRPAAGPQFSEYAEMMACASGSGSGAPAPPSSTPPAPPPAPPVFMAGIAAASGSAVAALGASALARSLAPGDAAAGAEPAGRRRTRLLAAEMLPVQLHWYSEAMQVPRLPRALAGVNAM